MLSWNDWQLELDVQDSPQFRHVLLVLMFCCLLPLLILACFEPLFIAILLLVFLQARYCWRCYWSEQASRGLVSLLCKQGQWSVTLNNGQCINKLQLKRYFVGTYFVLLVFQSNKIQWKGKREGVRSLLSHFALLPFAGRYRFIICPDQLGEESFRQLLVLLRYRASCLQVAQ